MEEKEESTYEWLMNNWLPSLPNIYVGQRGIIALTTRNRNSLLRAGVDTIEKLRNLYELDNENFGAILVIRNIGEKSIEEIKKVLER